MRKDTILRTFAIAAIILTLTGPLSMVQGPQEKIVVYAQQGGWAGFDPSTNFDVTSLVLVNTNEPLIYTSLPGSAEPFQPGLATSWDASADGLTWNFYLREGVKFHDGTDFTAESVKFSIERTITIGAGASYLWWAVDSIDVIDTYHVRFTLSVAQGLDVIAGAGYGAWIMCEDPSLTTEWYEEGNACGTGPYKLESWDGVAGDTVMVKNEDWWGIADPDIRDPYFDRVIFRAIPERTTQELQLLDGTLDFADNLPDEDLAVLKANPDIIINENPSFQNLFGMLNNKKFPTNVKEVRQALSWATPYDDIVEANLGYVVQARGAIPHGFYGYSDGVFQYSYDPVKAAELLDDAGYLVNPATGMRDDIPTITLDIQEGDQRESKTAQLMVDAYAEIGIDAEIESLLWTPRWDRAKNPDTAPHMFIYYWWPSLEDPWDYIAGQFHTPGDYGVIFELAHYENPTFDQIVDDAQILQATDREAALDLYVEAQNILVEDAAAIFIFDLILVIGQRADIKGYVDNPLYAGSAIFFKDIYREEPMVSEFQSDIAVIGLFAAISFVTLVELIKKRR